MGTPSRSSRRSRAGKAEPAKAGAPGAGKAAPIEAASPGEGGAASAAAALAPGGAVSGAAAVARASADAAPVARSAELGRVQKKAAELVLDDEAWRRGLTDEEASRRLDEALKRLDAYLAREAEAGTLTTESAYAAADEARRFLRGSAPR